MLGSCNVIAFVPTVQPDRARVFYETVLGLRFVSSDHYAMMFDANGVRLRIALVQEFKPDPFTILGWIVPDIASTVRELTVKGVVFERYEIFKQDELGICTFLSGEQVAWFKDPDGNTLSLTQSDKM
jgi:catechol 2,3-dioxygenase-like lactoylglutathione lyase family enzyme